MISEKSRNFENLDQIDIAFCSKIVDVESWNVVIVVFHKMI